MRFELDAEQSMLTEQIREYARQEIAPQVDSAHEATTNPLAALQELSEMGLQGITLSEELGGAEVDRITLCRLLTELAYASGSLAALVMQSNVLVNEHILRFGTEEQQQRWLPGIATGERRVAWAGSMRVLDKDDHSGLHATAHLGEQWLLEGSVSQVLLGAEATDILLYATDAEGRRHVFLIDANHEGLTREVQEDVLGLRGAQPTIIRCEKVVVSDQDRIGTEASAQEEIAIILNFARIAVAALINGVSQAAFDTAAAYARDRKQFGKPIAAFQAIQWKIAEMAMGAEAARLLVDQAAQAWQEGDDLNSETLGKGAFRFAADASTRTTTEAIQIHGGYGYTTEFPVERYYRDAMTLRSRWQG